MTALSDIIMYLLTPFMVAMAFVFIDLLCFAFLLDTLLTVGLPEFLMRFINAYVNVMLVLVFLMVQFIVLYGIAYVVSTV